MTRNIKSQARKPQEADGPLSEPEDGGDMFLQIAGVFPSYTALQPKISWFSHIYARPTMTDTFPEMLFREGQWFMKCLSVQARVTTVGTQSSS
jgi:hypothetical protein